MFDYLIVGAGLFGAVFAQQATQAGKSCLVVERRPHIGGNIYTSQREGIHVHQYGAHIFHTSSPDTWAYVNQFCTMTPFVNSPVANYKGELYNLPFNMNTFHSLWGVRTPQQAQAKIEQQKKEAGLQQAQNLREQAISLVGTDIYEKLIEGYTQKQWGRTCDQLPPWIIKRLPVRFTYDNNYYNDLYQGIPREGYTALVEALLAGCQLRLGEDYLADKPRWDATARRVLYTGCIDSYFGYRYGALAYRSLRFETHRLETANHQGVAVMNYTDAETPYTRIIEHKHFDRYNSSPCTVLSYEYSEEWDPEKEPYYPVNDQQNQELYQRYRALAAQEAGTLFGGRLGEYQYYDMDKVIEAALALWHQEG